MEALTFAEVLGWVRDLGTIAVLALIVWGAGLEWWVTGVQYRRAMQERDEQFQRVLAERDLYRDELFDVLGLAQRATRVADTIMRRPTNARVGSQAERHGRQPRQQPNAD